MQLTESEKVEINKARKISARWPKTRWIALLYTFVIMVSVATYLYNGAPLSGFILCGFAGYFSVRNLIVIIKSWKGIVPFKLLLKLLEEVENRPN